MDEQLGRAAAVWVDFVQQRATAIVVFFLAAALGSLFYAAGELGLDNDEMALFEQDVPFLQLREDFRSAFPKLIDPIVVVIDGDASDRVISASAQLAARLRRRPDLFLAVYEPGASSFFEENGLLYLSPDELEDVVDKLARAQPYLARLSRDPSLRGFLSALGQATAALGQVELDPADLADMLDRTSRAFEANVKGENHRLSWAKMMLGEHARDARREFLLVQPSTDFSQIEPAAPSLLELRRAFSELDLEGKSGVRVRMTGTWPLSSEEADQVRQQSTVAGFTAFVLVSLVLIVGLGSIRLVGASLLTLLIGLALTAGFAAAAVGHLNLISITFAVLFIGLSIDFAIHFCIRYRELLRLGNTLPDALRETARDIGGSLAVCAVTTAIGFFAFVPTDYLGVAELGLIAGTGMLISLVTNLTLLPALLATMAEPGRLRLRPPRPVRAKRLLQLPVRYARTVLVATLLLALGAAALVPRWSFDPNPLRMRDPTTPSVQTFDDLLADGKAFPWNMNVLAPDRARADQAAVQLAALDSVDHTVTLSDFVPDDQDEKLEILANAALLMGPALETPAERPQPSAREQIAAIDDLEQVLAGLEREAASSELFRAAKRLHAALVGFRKERLGDPAHAEQALAAIETSLFATLEERLRVLRAALGAHRVLVGDLPAELLETMVAPDGRIRIEVYPREDLNDNDALERYVEQVRSVAPQAFGVGLTIVESGRIVVAALKQALLVAAILIAALLLLVWRSSIGAALVAIPIGLATLFTAAVSVVLAVPLNFANVIVIPLLLGMGVDTGIHLVHRFRGAALPDGNLLRTSTAQAALLSALTTIASFGTLGASTHPGIASLGRLLTIGLSMVLISTLVVLPALVTLIARRRREAPSVA